MEPFRAFVDLALYRWLQQQTGTMEDDSDFKEWIRYFMASLQLCRIKLPEDKHSYKLMDAVDKSITTVATCFEDRFFEAQSLERLWVPRLEHHYWMQDVGEPIDDDLLETDESDTLAS
jgi:hypothetical protein